MTRAIKHVRNTDVAFLKLSKVVTPEGDRLTGYWLNVVNPKKVFLAAEFVDAILIVPEERCNWIEVSYA
jgi:hypothetical protein